MSHPVSSDRQESCSLAYSSVAQQRAAVISHYSVATALRMFVIFWLALFCRSAA